MSSQKIYKDKTTKSYSNLRIVSMIPGDQMVAGCFNFFDNSEGFF